MNNHYKLIRDIVVFITLIIMMLAILVIGFFNSFNNIEDSQTARSKEFDHFFVNPKTNNVSIIIDNSVYTCQDELLKVRTDTIPVNGVEHDFIFFHCEGVYNEKYTKH